MCLKYSMFIKNTTQDIRVAVQMERSVNKLGIFEKHQLDVLDAKPSSSFIASEQ